MSDQRKPDRTTVIRITIDHPVGEADREQIGLSLVLSEEEITQTTAAVDPVQRSLLSLVDEMLTAYRRAARAGGGE